VLCKVGAVLAVFSSGFDVASQQRMSGTTEIELLAFFEV